MRFKIGDWYEYDMANIDQKQQMKKACAVKQILSFYN